MNTFVPVVKWVVRLSVTTILICVLFVTSSRAIYAQNNNVSVIGLILDALLSNTPKIVYDSNGCDVNTYTTDKSRTPEVPVCFGKDGQMIDNPGAQVQPSGAPIDTNIPITDGLIPADMNGALPQACQGKANIAVNNALSHPDNIVIYKEASARSGLPWEVIAALHNVETGGSFDPTKSLVSGRKIGEIEPDLGNICKNLSSEKAKLTISIGSGCGFSSLLNSALYAAEHFNGKKAVALSLSPNGTPFQLIAGAFALYNGPGNTQCIGNTPKPETGGLYTGCGPTFLFEDHLYPFACFDNRHEKMYVIYCGDGRKCTSPNPYQGIGAMTFVKALQQRVGSIPTGTQDQGSLCSRGGPVDERGNPCPALNTNAQGMVDNIRSSCPGGQVTSSNANCIDRTTLSQTPKAMMKASALSYTYLQCVGFAFASAVQLNGVDPQQYGNACAQAKDSPTYKFIDRTTGPPLAGDLIVWHDIVNGSPVCGGSHYGHIAYVAQVYNSTNIKVAEANYGVLGSVNTRAVAISNNVSGWLRKR